jgi:PAS domain S-box-containing protein
VRKAGVREAEPGCATPCDGADRRGGEERLRLTLEVAGIGTWDWDAARDLVTASALTQALLGPAPIGAAHGFAGFLERVHPDDREAVNRALRAAPPDADRYQIEFRVAAGGDAVRWLAWQGQILRDAHGRAAHVTGIATDITAQKRAETQRELLARGERLRALGQMAGGIAHDLNQALAVVTGYADLAREALAEGNAAEAADQLEIIAQAARQGTETVKRLLTFTRQEEPGLLESVEVRQVLEEAARFTAPRWRDGAQAEGRPIRLQIEAEPGLRLFGLSYALREALINLILNAVDALPRGGEICLAAGHRSDRIEIQVTDTGIGMPAAVKRRIFEPFFTTKGERGSGLGLAMVFAIVERHEGEITVESIEGAGTTFRLTFPTREEPAHRETQIPTAGRVAPVRVLVVEDDPTIASMLARMLERLGCEVGLAPTGEVAVALLAGDRFDVVISDLSLGPGINGWDLADHVRRSRLGARFVLASGWSASIGADEATTRGVDGLLAKPYRMDEIRQVMERLT